SALEENVPESAKKAFASLGTKAREAGLTDLGNLAKLVSGGALSGKQLSEIVSSLKEASSGCFAAGTLISTPDGLVPIELLSPIASRVWTLTRGEIPQAPVS